ncbi:MAG: 2-oxo acid dehydrogenase subunit E2 [Treponema sp.]|jgi:pyruvate dehydrogenase E2 component (dihydrolipoamide acetyltransferase)|nr:2-oxo acid dehydrogenase subunit E2 [Treponema sp.]
MAHIVIMPRQGNTVESCIIVDWKVQEGDRVAADTPLCDVETDKATFEIPAGAEGTVLKLLGAAGDDVPVLKPIAVIGNPGEDWNAALGTPAPEAAPVALKEDPVKEALPRFSPVQEGRPEAASPRARHRAEKEGLSLKGLSGSGPGGRILERDVEQAVQERPRCTVAAREALRAGAAMPAVPGSGLGGRLTLADLAAGVKPAPAGTPSSGGVRPETAPKEEGTITETPVKGIRKIISDRMLRSLRESAPCTLHSYASAVRLKEMRKRMKAAEESLGVFPPADGGLGLGKISINDLILTVVSRVLPGYPYMNAHLVNEPRTGEAFVRTFERVHLGVAVDTHRGLMVPVIRNADLRSLRQISAEAKELAEACHQGGIRPEALSGSTFTVTNLGSLGISSFTPILNAPEVAILGVCGIALKPLSRGGKVVFEPAIGFSLTFNHQVVDGAPAARFLKALGEAVGDMDLWLL